MPKLNHIHIIERLKNRIDQLENGEALEARDINTLLNPIQQQQLKDGRLALLTNVRDFKAEEIVCR